MHTEQTNALVTVYYNVSLFIAPTCINANSLPSVGSYSLPAKLHKGVHAVLMVVF
jgi:hypothetical protein